MRAFIALLLIASSALGGSFVEKAPPGGEQGPLGAFFALSVADVARMSNWYRNVLGLRITASGESPDKIAKFAILDGDGILIEMVEHRKAKPRNIIAPTAEDSYQIHGIFKAGLIVRNLDATYRKIKDQGIAIAYDIGPTKDVAMRSFSIRDPEGNLLQFFGH